MNLNETVLPRGNSDQARTWGRRVSNDREIVFVTDEYGHVIDLVGDYEIGKDGTVKPSVTCPNCPWHEFVTLAEYRP